MALKEKEETCARLLTATHRFNKPPPLSLKMSYSVIGPKLQLCGPVLPRGKHPPSLFPSRQCESVQVEEASEAPGPTLVPERPAISTAAATTQPLGGSCQPKRRWLSREPMPKPWRGLADRTRSRWGPGLLREHQKQPRAPVDPQHLRRQEPQWRTEQVFDVSYCCRK
ncbi:hypothetical protein LEMLEM_LOCUS15491 [Lemmus lemmus]